MRIKIVHLITDLQTGGAETMLYKLISGMDKRRFQNIVVSMTDAGTLGGMIKKLNIPVFTLEMSRGYPSPRGGFRLFQILRKECPDVLQTWLYHADLLGLIVGKLALVPCIAWNLRRSVTPESETSTVLKIIVSILASLSSFPDGVLVNSEAGLRSHEKKGYHPKGWRLIPNGFDLERFSPDSDARLKLRMELGIPSDMVLIGLIARFHPLKDHECFLKAASELVKTSHNLHFVFVGKDVDQQNEDLGHIISALGLKKVVHLLGERADVSQILAGLDIVCSTSKEEGFSNVIGEAMACGIPCVVTDVGDSAKIVGPTGRIISPKDITGLVGACLDLIELGEDARQKLGLTARQRIEKNFNISSVVNSYETFYDELIRSKSGHR